MGSPYHYGIFAILPFADRHQKQGSVIVAVFSAFCLSHCLSCLSAFRRPPSKAGRGVAFLKLARAKRGRWLVLDEFAKYAFFGLKRKRRNFERSVLKYVSIKIPALTHSGRKRRVCVNAADRLLPPGTKNKFSLYFPSSPRAAHNPQKTNTLCNSRQIQNILTLPHHSNFPRPFLLFCLSQLAIKSRSWGSLPYTRQSAARAMDGVGRICKIRIFLA